MFIQTTYINQKHTTTKEKAQIKHKENQQTVKEEIKSRKEQKNYKNNQKTVNQMAI